MRRLAIAALFGALICAAFQRTGGAEPGSVRELGPGVFFWKGDRARLQQANCGWVVFKDYVVVIDANFPWGAREILDAIRKTTRKPVRFVFDTHYHSDHTFGNSVFADAGATLVCSEECATELRQRGAADWKSFAATSESGEPLTGERYSLRDHRLEQPSLLFRDRMTFDDGTQRLELIRLGPAHTAGDAVAYLPAQGILFTGDLCVNWTRGNNVSDPNADPENWIRALDSLSHWKADTVVPGHGDLGSAGTLQAQRAYLFDMWRQVREGVRGGKTAEELTATIDLSRHLPFAADPRFTSGAIRGMFRKAVSR
jgi:glyoxylase-like metal-dependent hydrolase (beta-lactamase superfamily II)